MMHDIGPVAQHTVWRLRLYGKINLLCQSLDADTVFCQLRQALTPGQLHAPVELYVFERSL